VIVLLSRWALRIVFSRFVLRRLLRRYRPSTLALLSLAGGLAIAFVRRRNLRDEVRRHASAHIRAVKSGR
jgi:hypothetical protein